MRRNICKVICRNLETSKKGITVCEENNEANVAVLGREWVRNVEIENRNIKVRLCLQVKEYLRHRNKDNGSN